MAKDEVINRFNSGTKVRLTKGLWNFPKRDGKFAQSVEDIEKFYSWANAVDAREDDNGIIDLRGASHCDMY